MNRLERANQEKGFRPKRHELNVFMDGVKQQMATEFAQLSQRSKEDPGTAGDQAEEDWAVFLRDWLPATYPIVTKGRLINHEGESSPQVDIIVLNPNYPKYLLHKKMYFADGVIAAFECKMTIRSPDLKKFFENSRKLKNLIEPRLGTPFDEVHQPPFYGLLAHTTTICGEGKNDIYEKIFACIENAIEHPRELPDLICINSGSTYLVNRYILWQKFATEHNREVLSQISLGQAIGAFLLEEHEFENLEGRPENSSGFNLAALIRRITAYIAFQDTSVRGFSDYLSNVGGHGGIGKFAFWRIESLSSKVRNRIAMNGFEDERWSKWSQDFEPL